jgi:hypothetical protein
MSASQGLTCLRISNSLYHRRIRGVSGKRCQHILATPMGNQSYPAMAHYGMEIYHNTIIPSIYTNSEVQYVTYLHVGNYFDPSCVNYFGIVEQENFSLGSLAAFSQPMTMQQIMLMNNLYGRSNSDGLANYFEQPYAIQVTRMEVAPNSYLVSCTVASGFHSAQYTANHYSQMNGYASTNVHSNNAQAYSTPS